MNPDDLDAFNAIIAATAEMYGQKRPSDMLMALYWRALEHLTLEQIKEGISRHIASLGCGQFMPKPVDIMPRRIEASGLMAWEDVIEAMEHHGAYRTVQFQDGVTAAIIRDMGGWPEVCYRQMHDENEIWLQKEFVQRYKEYAANNRVFRGALTGLSDQDNSQKGLTAWMQDGPIYIESCQTIPRAMLVEPISKALPAAEGLEGDIGAIIKSLAHDMGNSSGQDNREK